MHVAITQISYQSSFSITVVEYSCLMLIKLYKYHFNGLLENLN